jgi:hypothetical protein
VCKSIEGRQFHADTRGWSVPPEGMASLVAALSQLPGVQVSKPSLLPFVFLVNLQDSVTAFRLVFSLHWLALLPVV